jgi:hypothetical protein
MGYTHYYRGWLTLNEALIEDIKRIIDASGVQIAGPNGVGLPELVAGEGISLNGAGEEMHETFSLVHGVNHTGIESFCKTAREPYDLVVCTILLRASNRSKLVVQSDGDWNNEEWVAARELYLDIFGEEARKPKHLREATPAPQLVGA